MLRKLIREHKTLTTVLTTIFVILVLFFVAVIFFFASLNSARNSAPSMGMGGGFGGAMPEAPGFYAEDSASNSKRVSSEFYPPIPTPGRTTVDPNVERKVITNGSLSLLVKKAEDAVKQITDYTLSINGFIDSSNLHEVSDGVKNGNITIRVPQDKFFATFEEIKSFAVKVEQEQVSRQDVTDQIVDIDARLRNLKKSEEALVSILNRWGELQQVLQVQRELASMREQIERLEAQKVNLDNQVVMSTIYIELVSEPDVTVFGLQWRPLYVAKVAVRDTLKDLSVFTDSLIRFAIRLPLIFLKIAIFLLVILVLLVASRKLYRWGKRKFFTVTPMQ